MSTKNDQPNSSLPRVLPRVDSPGSISNEGITDSDVLKLWRLADHRAPNAIRTILYDSQNASAGSQLRVLSEHISAYFSNLERSLSEAPASIELLERVEHLIEEGEGLPLVLAHNTCSALRQSRALVAELQARETFRSFVGSIQTSNMNDKVKARDNLIRLTLSHPYTTYGKKALELLQATFGIDEISALSRNSEIIRSPSSVVPVKAQSPTILEGNPSNNILPATTDYQTKKSTQPPINYRGLRWTLRIIGGIILLVGLDFIFYPPTLTDVQDTAVFFVESGRMKYEDPETQERMLNVYNDVKEKANNFAAVGWVCLVVGSIINAIPLWMKEKEKRMKKLRKCPLCTSMIKREAVRCPKCQGDLTAVSIAV
jgi:hypothetical protein